MSILSWIETQKSEGGLWTRCYQCGAVLYIKHLKENYHVCFACHSHLQMTSRERLQNLIDVGTWQPFDETLSSIDPLKFYDQKSYTSRLKDAQYQTGLQDSVLTGTGLLEGIPIALGIMDFNFMGGSMGSVVGEKFTRLIEYATKEGLTLILVCASGGARMHEGVLSLMQMAKISAALNIYQNSAHLMYIAVLTSPTTGGVTASFAMLGDLILAEPNALIGFAGRRVIEQTLQEKLPENFQTAEYLLEHGLLDLIISREFLKPALYEILSFYKDVPLKRRGQIPKNFFQSLNLLTEEKLRRQFAKTGAPSLTDRGLAQRVLPQRRRAEGRLQGETFGPPSPQKPDGVMDKNSESSETEKSTENWVPRAKGPQGWRFPKGEELNRSLDFNFSKNIFGKISHNLNLNKWTQSSNFKTRGFAERGSLLSQREQGQAASTSRTTGAIDIDIDIERARPGESPMGLAPAGGRGQALPRQQRSTRPPSACPWEASFKDEQLSKFNNKIFKSFYQLYNF